jgi:hypothetical protein
VLRCAARAQIEGAGKLEKLKYLYLYGNDLRDAGALAFAGVCSCEIMPALKQLLLNSNRIGDAGAAGLCKRWSGPSLDRLSLHDNCIGDAGAAALADALSARTLIVSAMTLHSNPELTAAGQERMREVTGGCCELAAPVAGKGPTPYIPLNHTPQRWIDSPHAKDLGQGERA